VLSGRVLTGPFPFKPFILQNYATDIIFRSLTPPLFSFSFQALFPIFFYHSFDILGSSSKKSRDSIGFSVTEVRQRFREFASPIIGNGIAIYTVLSGMRILRWVQRFFHLIFTWPLNIGFQQTPQFFRQRVAPFCKHLFHSKALLPGRQLFFQT